MFLALFKWSQMVLILFFFLLIFWHSILSLMGDGEYGCNSVSLLYSFLLCDYSIVCFLFLTIAHFTALSICKLNSCWTYRSVYSMELLDHGYLTSASLDCVKLFPKGLYAFIPNHLCIRVCIVSNLCQYLTL